MQSATSREVESDFSLRKMKIAGAVLLGQMFASSLLPVMALALVFVPITTEFKWTPTQFGYATTALMWCGGLVGPLLGYLVDRTGVRLMWCSRASITSERGAPGG